MNGPRQNLTKQYIFALQDYLAGVEKNALQTAHELGQQAQTKGLSISDLVAIHKEALVILLPGALTARESTRLVDVGTDFFIACLSLFDMNADDCRAIIAMLRNTNKMLAEQIARYDRQSPENEEQFGQVVISISDHIYVTEVTETGKRVNLYISPHVEALTGYPIEKFIDDWRFWPSSVIHAEDQAMAAEQAEQLALGRNSEVEYRLVRADGEIIWVRDSARIEHQGTSKIVYGVVSDITELKQAEIALAEERARLAQRVAERTAELRAANAELAQASQLKDKFLANMSHELRTPLNAILGMSEVLRREIYGSLNEKQLDALHYIEESGQHLLALVTDILDLSKIEAGKLKLQIGSVSVEDVCQTSLRLIKQAAQEKQVKVLSKLDDKVTVLQVDGRRLKQILVNLLSNAVKFTTDGGQIGLEVEGDPEQNVVHFTVWDTGIGISEEDMPYLFQPFVQVDSSLSRPYEGTGLGLSLVSRLAQMHGGKVSVKSEPGQGSRFTVSLPWRVAGDQTQLADSGLSAANQPESATISRPSPAVILLVEDNEVNIITLRDALEGSGYEVIVARNGVEAINRTMADRPDLVLMNVQMPVMDGLEATRHIRANTELSTIPIIALTAMAMPGDQERCLAAGVDDYMSKPITLKGLIKAIETQLQKTGNREYQAERNL